MTSGIFPFSELVNAKCIQNNAEFLPEYVETIFQRLSVLENNLRLPEGFIEKTQTWEDKTKIITSRQRCILVDWMCKAAVSLKLRRESLCLAVTIVDRMLACRIVAKNKLHLLGLGALMIASKVEEIHPILLSDLLQISNNSFSENEMLRVEKVILAALDHRLCIPTPVSFTTLFTTCGNFDVITTMVVNYLVELSLCSYAMTKFLSSEIAASAVYLAAEMQDLPAEQLSLLRRCPGYDEIALQGCIAKLRTHASEIYAKYNNNPIYQKYKAEKYFRVSQLPIPTELPIPETIVLPVLAPRSDSTPNTPNIKMTDSGLPAPSPDVLVSITPNKKTIIPTTTLDEDTSLIIIDTDSHNQE